MATELARGRDGDGSPNGAAHGRKHGRPRPLSCHALGGGYRARLGHRPTQHLALRHVRGRSSGRPRRSPADQSPARPVSLLIVTLAPPFVTARRRSRAASATSNPRDAVRRFIEDALGAPWTALGDAGVFLLHAVKCAIVRNHHGSQNPPARTVDRCAPQHLASELNVIKPFVVVTMGLMAYRALVRALETSSSPLHPPARLPLTEPPVVASTDGVLVDQASHSFRLFVSPFIRTPRFRRVAAAILTRAASAAGIRSDA